MPLPLPVEIVEYILDLVSPVPDPTAHLSPPYSLYSEHDVPVSAVQLSARYLFSLALVCKLWNTICTPRLYRCLAIGDSTAIDALIRTLERSQKTAAISGRTPPLGSLTRHLIIALSDSPVGDETEHSETRVVRRFGNLGRLARCLPHLQILSTSILTQDMWGLPPPHHGKDFAASVTETSAHSLLKLHLDREPFVLFSRRELRTLLESAPNLVAISGAGVCDSLDCPAALPYLPKLKFLVVNNDQMRSCNRTEHENSLTPVLDHIHFRQSRPSTYSMHLLSVQGSRLTSVSLDLRLFMDSTRVCSDWLSALTSFCHNLSYLEICIDNWSSFPRLEPPPPVDRLGVCLLIPRAGVAAICKSLATIQSSTLNVVQLMDPGMFEWFASPPADNVESAWNPLVHRAFRVVDCDGRELGPPGQSIKNGAFLGQNQVS